MNPVVRRVIVLALALAFVVAHAWWRNHSPPVAKTAAAENSWQKGRLVLTDCTIGSHTADGAATEKAFCTRLRVPENWDAPGGRQIELKLAIVRAQAGEADPDVVAFLDGGPGGAATEDYPLLAGTLSPLRQRHHILLLDQRGTGGSNPLTCPQLPQGASPERPSEDSGTITNNGDTALAALRRCLADLQSRADPAHYATTDAIRDLESARQALGAPPLDLLAVSYGTRVAQQYVRRYPQAVRSMVLDSPVPNRLALLSEHARNLELALRGLFALCQAAAPCAQRFGDPYATLYQLRDRLVSKPQKVELRDPVSFAPLTLTLTADDLTAVVRFYAYNPLSAALLPLMLDEAMRGNYAPLLGQKQWLADDLSDHITGGAELSVVCTDDADLLAPQAQDANTLLGNRLITTTLAACEFWPHGTRPADFHAPLVSAVPTLVLSGQFDPVTPPTYGAEIVHTLSNARALTLPGQGHSVASAGCMPQLLQRFVETLQTRTLNAGCLQRLGATPAFIDYNGASP